MKRSRRRRRIDPNTLQLIRQIMVGVLVLSLLGLLIWGTWYVTRLPALTIQTVEVEGGETISHQLVTTLVEGELEGEYLRLIPKRFTLLYPENAITDLVGKVDRIKDVRTEKSDLTALHISFDEYVPDALWCDQRGEVCVFLDTTGFAFAHAPMLTGGRFLRLEKVDVMPVIDVQAFDTHAYIQLQELVALLENEGWFVNRVAVDAAKDAYLTLTAGGELKVTLADSPEQIVDNLFTVLNSPEFEEIEPGDFEYIDLRFGNKVFVNELGPESEPVLASTSEDELE